MKRVMAIVMMLILLVPFFNVKAIEGNYYVYNKGNEVNFYTYEGDTTGSTTIILGDPGADSKYVKTLVLGVTAPSATPYAEAIDISNGDITIFKNTPGYTTLLNEINDKIKGAPYARNVADELSLITLDELIDVFGATADGDKYVIDVDKWGPTFSRIEVDLEGVPKNGIYTQTVVDDAKNVWVVKFPKNAAGDVTSITVEKQPVDSPETWGLIPVLFLDKTYDCVERENKEEYACYVCKSGDDKYIWTATTDERIGIDECDIVLDKTKSTCVESPSTGVEEYFLEFAIVVVICGVALIVLKKKDLFKSI